ncbi:MAG: TonB family protein, partial [Bacteroidetes bacterium]|nr:TonB family protein [Bacteroidota bacterium]
KALANANESWISNPYTQEGQPPLYTFGLSLRLNAGLPVSDVVCTSHNADINFKSKDKVLVSLKEDEKFGGNRDFILKYRLKGDQIATGLLMFPGKEENFFLAMIQPPKKVMPENIPPREYVFIVDVSGSMSGFPLEVSKTLLKDLIGNLRPSDKFNVILFAGGSEILSAYSLDASQQNIKKAIDFIDKQQGGGGTELLPALKKALAIEGTGSFSRTFVIATDGYVTVEKEAFELIRNNLGKANFFSFGIGSSVDRYLIEGMAHVGNGLPFIATNQNEANQMAAKFRKYVSNPVLTNIKIDFNGWDVYDVEPPEIPDVFSERPVLIFGKYRGNPSGYINLQGKTGGMGINQRFDLAEHSPSAENSAIRSLWAREKIRLLDDFAGREQSAELTNEITSLGLKYNLLTNYTSFVAIDSEIRNENGQMISVKQPLPLPHGVSNYAIGGAQVSGIMMKNGAGSQGIYAECDELEVMSIQAPAKEEVVFTVVESAPEFIGGDKAFQEFIKSNMIYPKEAAVNGITGTVYIAFIINQEGAVSDVKVIRSANPLLDNEAMRVIQLTSGKWKPGLQKGKAVKVQMVIPVKFKL